LNFDFKNDHTHINSIMTLLLVQTVKTYIERDKLLEDWDLKNPNLCIAMLAPYIQQYCQNLITLKKDVPDLYPNSQNIIYLSMFIIILFIVPKNTIQKDLLFDKYKDMINDVEYMSSIYDIVLDILEKEERQKTWVLPTVII